MTEAQEYERKRWIGLALLCVAQFVVVLDASIVNVALPTIGDALSFSQDDLSWVVNAYVLTFGGFLLLGGRMADLLGRRRVFMGGLILFALASLAGGLAESSGALIAGARRAGPRRRDPLARRALDRHHDLQGRRRAQQGARRLGRGRRLGRRRGRAARRRADRVRRLGVGAVGQRPDRARRRLPGAAAARREPLGVRDPGLRLRRRRQRHGRARAARLRAGRGPDAGWGSAQTIGLLAAAVVAARPRSSRSSGARRRRWCRSRSSACGRSPARTWSGC